MVNKQQHSESRSKNSRFRFVTMGSGDRVVVFLHGLFGTPEHWRHIMGDLAVDYRVIAPQLPIDYQPNRRRSGVRSIAALTDYVADFLTQSALPHFVVCGNSLGGLISIEICLRYPERVRGLVLAGSAGLYERSFVNGVRPRPTREFVRTVVSDIFHDPAMVTDELVEEWYQAIQDRDFVRFVLGVSRATRER
jgi:pimeloyl-ACP methyl ester carboxylesterase